MLQVKLLKKPCYKSGKVLKPGEVSTNKAYGVKIVNVGGKTLYVDSVKTKRK